MKTVLSFVKDLAICVWWYIAFICMSVYSAVFNRHKIAVIHNDRHIYPKEIECQDKRQCQFILDCTRKISYGYCPEKCSLYEK